MQHFDKSRPRLALCALLLLGLAGGAAAQEHEARKV
ncbi:hypothetical protein L537_1227, partial [Bordetella hinzii 1277]